MQNMILIGFSICAIAFVTFSQDVIRKTDGSFLLSQFESGTSLHQYDELLIDARSIYKKDNGHFEIRICTDKPFIIARQFDTGDSDRIYSLLKNELGVTDDEILFARSEDCASKIKDEILTEVWWVEKDRKLSPSVEYIKPCQIKDTLHGDELLKNGDYYKALTALKNQIDNASEKKNLIGFVIGYYGVEPSKSLLQKMKEAEKRFAKEIREGKIIVRAHKSKIAEAEKGEKYERILVLTTHVKNSCC